MRTALSLVALLFLALGAPLLQKSPKFKVKVLVTAELNESGFIDPDNQKVFDSVKDIRTEMEKNSLLELVQEPEGADVVFEVLDREAADGYCCVIKTRLSVGDYRSEAADKTTTSWRATAKLAAVRVSNFAKQNYDHIMERREKR
jgi:hypothetical protein